MNPTAPSGARRLLLTAGGLLLAIGASFTAAAYTDVALLGMGSGTTTAVGNPHRFDIAVRDANGSWQDAETTSGAVVLPLSGSSSVSTRTAVEFRVELLNRDPGVAGDLFLQLYDPDSGADDLFSDLLFDVAVDGDPVAERLSAQALNDRDIAIEQVAPGETHTVSIKATLAHGGLANAGKTTQLGLRVNGESR